MTRRWGLSWTMACGALGAACALLLMAACSPSAPPAGQAVPAAPAAASTAPAPASSVAVAAQEPAKSDEAASAEGDGDSAVIQRVDAVIRKHHLTTLADTCLDYMVDDSDGATVDIDVHEKHDTRCGGDPETSPRLFSFKLDRASGQLSTDALDLADGDFQPIE